MNHVSALYGTLWREIIALYGTRTRLCKEELSIIAIVTLQDFPVARLYVIMTYLIDSIKETNGVVEGAV